jgi:KaiC/GvpD/RAD55 family RecA-like ATPase
MPYALDEIEAAGAGSFGIPTGFADLDSLLAGWSEGYLIVIGGRPSSGKTTLLLHFCRTASIKYGLPAMVISGEMNSTDLQSRLLSAEARVPLQTMRTGQMNDEDWTRLALVMTVVADTPIHIGTPHDFLMEDLDADVARLARESGLKLLLIDSLQWITDSEASSRVSVEFTLQRLKRLAEKVKIPIIITAQAERGQGEPLTTNAISRLVYHDAIERVADVIVMLHRPDQDELEHPRAGEADLIVAKNRNGPTATITVAFQGHYCRYVDMAPDEYSMFRRWRQATTHDRGLFKWVLREMPPDGQVIDWLKNNFMLKALPLRHLEVVEQVAKEMSLRVVGFDDKEADDRYTNLRSAIENFHSRILYYTFADQSGNWLEVPNEWRDREDRTQYNTALNTITEVRNAFVDAYDSFLQTCHRKGIDYDASSGH